MGLLNKEKLLKKQELEVVKVDLGEGDYVFVRQMTGHERNEYEKSILKRTRDNKGRSDYEVNLDDFRAKLAVCTVCDDKGNLILSIDDYKQLSHNMSAERLEKIINEAQRINHITEEDKEELLKNSEAAPGGNSSSGSAKS